MTAFPLTGKKRTTNLEIFIAEDVPIIFHTTIHFVNMSLARDIRAEVMRVQFLSRRSGVDTWPLMPAENFCGDFPPEFHAMLSCGAQLLFFNNSKNRVYSDERDMVIHARGIMQTQARRYEVDVNSMAERWPEVRQWLGHANFQAPLTIEELIGNLKRQGKAEVKS